MANQQVIDELVVKLTLDAKGYQDKEKLVINLINRTEVNLRDADKKQVDRDRKTKKRNQETLKSVKELAQGFKALALTVASMLGVGSVAGIVGAVMAFAGMETGLRRAAVSTGLSNKELQAWSSTARRLGGDAQAGAQAIADLAREQKQFNITGQAPTMQAFARMGVRMGPNTPIVDALEQAQQIYRAAGPGQKQNIESGLAANGVGPDLILAIKSEKDVRAAYTESLAQAATEDRKNLDKLADAAESVKNALLNMANGILAIVGPYLTDFGKYAQEAAKDLSAFVDKVAAAGGGLDGFMKILGQESPQLATFLKDLSAGFHVLAQGVDIVAYGFQSLYGAVKGLFDWVDSKLSLLTGGTEAHPLRDFFSAAGTVIKDTWNRTANEAEREGPLNAGGGGAIKLTPGAAARIKAGEAGGTSANPSIAELASYLVSQGMDPSVALGLAVNAEGESWKGSGHAKANAVNPTSGASGIFQYLGPRLRRFQETHGGLSPHQTSWQTQADFLQDPQEKARLRQAIAGQSGVYNIARGINDKFEANNMAGEGVRRATYATQLASAYGGTNGAGVGQQINIQSVNVAANSPQEFTNGLTRQSGVQNYNGAVR